MDLIDRLLQYDKDLMISINSKWDNPVLDFVCQHIRETYFWAPLYLFFITLAVINFGKKGWLWVLAAIATVALTDQVSSNLIKNNILRLRPCRDQEIAHQIRFFINYCPGSSSFTSSHATNHFGITTFIVATLRPYLGNPIRWLFLASAAVCYAQVYVGVHYPIDVICGATIGTAIGYGMSRIFNNKIGLPTL